MKNHGNVCSKAFITTLVGFKGGKIQKLLFKKVIPWFYLKLHRYKQVSNA